MTLTLDKIIPGGVLETDHRHNFTNDNTCSRCRLEIPEDEVPIILWTHGGRRMLIYCEPCLGIPREPPLHGEDCSCPDCNPYPGDVL